MEIELLDARWTFDPALIYLFTNSHNHTVQYVLCTLNALSKSFLHFTGHTSS